MEIFFLEIENMIKKKGLQGKEESNDNFNIIPKIFYYGCGKSASTSIQFGFNEPVAHWHNVRHFEFLFETNLLSKNQLSLIDFIFYLSNKYNFKPLLIECVREPISRSISDFMYKVSLGWEKCNNYTDAIKQIKQKGVKLWCESIIIYKKYFKIDLLKDFDKNKKFYFKDHSKAKLLFLRFDDLGKRQEIFKNIGYEFKNKKLNENLDNKVKKIYEDVKENITFNKEELEKIYDVKCEKIWDVRKFYKDFYLKKFLITRFSILDKNWKGYFLNKENKFDEYKNKLFNKNRLDFKLEIFEKLTLKSIINQKTKDFDWNIYSSIYLPDEYKNKLELLIDKYNFINILYVSSHKEFWDDIVNKSKNYKKFLTIRLDDDDGLNENYFSELEKINYKKNSVVSFYKGKKIRLVNNKIEYGNEWIKKNTAIGLASFGENIYRLEPHLKIHKNRNVIYPEIDSMVYVCCSDYCDTLREFNNNHIDIIYSLNVKDETKILKCLDNLKDYNKNINFRVILNTSKNFSLDIEDTNVKICNKWDKKKVGKDLLKGHFENFKYSKKKYIFSYFIPLADNCLFFKQMDLSKLNKVNSNNLPRSFDNWYFKEKVLSNKSFLNKLKDNKIYIGQIEGSVLEYNLALNIFKYIEKKSILNLKINFPLEEVVFSTFKNYFTKNPIVRICKIFWDNDKVNIDLKKKYNTFIYKIISLSITNL